MTRSLLSQLNRADPTPLYRQLSLLLAETIEQGELAPDRQLPTEAELAERYGVNRLTVRQAVAEIARTGLIVTVAGKGSFVARQPIRYEVSVGSEASLTRAMAEQGRDVALRLLRKRVDPDPDIRTRLATSGRIWRYTLLREVDGFPLSLSETSVAERRFPGLSRHWQGDSSLYEALERAYGVRMRRGERTLTAEAALPADSEHLMVPVGAPLLVLRGTNVADEGEPVAMVEHRSRGDRVQLTLGGAG